MITSSSNNSSALLHGWDSYGSYASKVDNSLNKYLLSTFYVPGTVLGA